jgi:hypothetical protein
MNRIRVLIVFFSALLLIGCLTATPATAGPLWLTSNASWTNPDQTTSSPRSRVVDLRYGHHGRFDRVVIHIRGTLPGGLTHYQRRFTYDASGLPVPIGGRSGLQVSLSPAYAHNSAGENLYRGPRVARPRFQTLKSLAFTGDFEGHVTFAFALTHRAPYRLFTLENPRRIVIDFRHKN